MKKVIVSIPCIIILLFVSSCGQNKESQNSTTADVIAPKVVSTFPTNGAQDVDPATTTIWVKFDETMLENNWSWAYADQTKFPVLNGDPSYSENNTKCNLPVKLESNKEYEIWINTEKYNKFKDVAGNSAVPYKLSFKTK